MKAAKEHRVPLSEPALAILKSLPHEEGNEYVFVGPTAGAGLSNMAMTAVLNRVHGRGYKRERLEEAWKRFLQKTPFRNPSTRLMSIKPTLLALLKPVYQTTEDGFGKRD
jgi:hypothetical protein